MMSNRPHPLENLILSITFFFSVSSSVLDDPIPIQLNFLHLSHLKNKTETNGTHSSFAAQALKRVICISYFPFVAYSFHLIHSTNSTVITLITTTGDLYVTKFSTYFKSQLRAASYTTDHSFYNIFFHLPRYYNTSSWF